MGVLRSLVWIVWRVHDALPADFDVVEALRCDLGLDRACDAACADLSDGHAVPIDAFLTRVAEALARTPRPARTVMRARGAHPAAPARPPSAAPTDR
jgi:hypothetical protein